MVYFRLTKRSINVFSYQVSLMRGVMSITPDISAACKESNLFHYSCLARWVLHTLTIMVNLTFFNPYIKYEKDSHIYTIYKRFFAQKNLHVVVDWSMIWGKILSWTILGPEFSRNTKWTNCWDGLIMWIKQRTVTAEITLLLEEKIW